LSAKYRIPASNNGTLLTKRGETGKSLYSGWKHTCGFILYLNLMSWYRKQKNGLYGNRWPVTLPVFSVTMSVNREINKAVY
jgi:hypothetical protein